MSNNLSNKELGKFKHLKSLEENTFKFLALRSEERELVERLSKVRKSLEGMKKNSHLMTLIGQMDRIQRRVDDPEGNPPRRFNIPPKESTETEGISILSAEEVPEPDPKKRKAEKIEKKSTAKERLTKKINSPKPSRDNSLQSDPKKKD